MSNLMLKIEDVSKKYRYGSIGTGSLKQDINKWWEEKILRKNTGFFKNDTGINAEASLINTFWALKDISFEVNQGDVLGIIGPNGAGKSTLLKILSRITRPTTGTIRGKGKISSLLEVGTGFQPELTGYENIYTSGHILGMKKREIKAKFDDIVTFSGVSDFIDTPVKRYSSGMYMRLAFAVAAFLDPDILIVDEVLAVGDADFQKKCLNKMQEVSHEKGRTIIFVSHNLQAIANLCNRAIWLNKGKIMKEGPAADVVRKYISSYQKSEISEEWESPELAPGTDAVKMKNISAKAHDESGESFITVKTAVVITTQFWNTLDDGQLNVNLKLFTTNGECVFAIGSPLIDAQKGILILQNIIPADLLNNARYIISLTVMKNITQLVTEFPSCLSFDVEDDRQGIEYFGSWPGIIRPVLKTQIYFKQPAADKVYA